MSKIYLEDSLTKIREHRANLYREYSPLSAQWRKCWDGSPNDKKVSQIQATMQKIYNEIRETEGSHDYLTPEEREIIESDALDLLNELYDKCSREKVPYGDLIIAIERGIFRKTFGAGNIKIDRNYKLEKFVPKKKE